MMASFTRKEMITALESNGYVIKQEDYYYMYEEYKNYHSTRMVTVDFVYENDQQVSVSEYVITQNKVVEEVFSKLLNKKILKLLNNEK
jgi:hypothetical protein